MAIQGYWAIVKRGGISTSMTAVATTELIAGLVYQISDESRRVLDRTKPVVVKVDGAVANETTYTVNYMFGIVTFNNDQGPDATVTVDASYIPTQTVTGAYSYGLNFSPTLLDETSFDQARVNGGARVRKMGLIDVSASLSQWGDPVDKYFKDAIANKEPVMLEIHPGGDEDDYFRGWFVVETDNLSGGVDELEGTELSFQLDAASANEANGNAGFAWSTIY